MSTFTEGDSYQVIWLVRRLFRAFAQKSNENLEEFGISSADRAVLEFLFPNNALSVPEIASKYNVSRQHVQVTVNSLLEHGLVTTQENPRHKRSSLIALKPAGSKLFKQILKSDEKAVEELFSRLSAKDVQVTRQTLQSLLDNLS